MWNQKQKCQEQQCGIQEACQHLMTTDGSSKTVQAHLHSDANKLGKIERRIRKIQEILQQSRQAWQQYLQKAHQRLQADQQSFQQAMTAGEQELLQAQQDMHQQPNDTHRLLTTRVQSNQHLDGTQQMQTDRQPMDVDTGPWVPHAAQPQRGQVAVIQDLASQSRSDLPMSTATAPQQLWTQLTAQLAQATQQTARATPVLPVASVLPQGSCVPTMPMTTPAQGQQNTLGTVMMSIPHVAQAPYSTQNPLPGHGLTTRLPQQLLPVQPSADPDDKTLPPTWASPQEGVPTMNMHSIQPANLPAQTAPALPVATGNPEVQATPSMDGPSFAAPPHGQDVSKQEATSPTTSPGFMTPPPGKWTYAHDSSYQAAYQEMIQYYANLMAQAANSGQSLPFDSYARSSAAGRARSGQRQKGCEWQSARCKRSISLGNTSTATSRPSICSYPASQITGRSRATNRSIDSAYTDCATTASVKPRYQCGTRRHHRCQ